MNNGSGLGRHENQIAFDIRGCVFTVYNKLGPGLFESAYEAALVYELRKAGCKVESQVPIDMEYETTNLGIAFGWIYWSKIRS